MSTVAQLEKEWRGAVRRWLAVVLEHPAPHLLADEATVTQISPYLYEWTWPGPDANTPLIYTGTQKELEGAIARHRKRVVERLAQRRPRE